MLVSRPLEARLSPLAPTLHDFTTWAPLIRLLRECGDARQSGPDGCPAGRIGRGGWSVPVQRDFGRRPAAGEFEREQAAVDRVRALLPEDDEGGVRFVARFADGGRRAVVHVLEPGPAVEDGIGGQDPGALLLVEGAVPEPWLRLPETYPGTVPAPTRDPELLERTLRERLPDEVGATEEELAAAEARLGLALPEELRALYRVTRARWKDWGGDYERAVGVFRQLGCEVFPPAEVYVAHAATRESLWPHAATEAVGTAPDAAVQGLVGSPGWLVFGDNGGGDRIAIDLTPGPSGHVGQIVIISHEESVGAGLVADSLTDLVLGRRATGRRGRGHATAAPPVAYVNASHVPDVEAAAHPGLEVLCLGVWDTAPLSLAPFAALPRLRTLTAYPDTLADPLEIAELKHLEFLKLTPEDWRVLLDAGAVPRTLKAAAIEPRNHHPLAVTAVANELLTLWNRPLIQETVLEGDLDDPDDPAE
ncbi:SMI1/KNR4 family protein [Streptomyces sp. NPDC048604]|uniref:SMI1/KNR4 family protein n=1 Tax=Streptomyces sp. NPDC048604 TaxID=3365578 RepID=UPI00370FEEC5